MRVQFGVGMLWVKALAGVAGGMTAASLTLLSRWGRHFWVHGVLWVKTLSSDERRWRSWRRALLEGIVFRDTARCMASLVLGQLRLRLGLIFLLVGKLKGCC